MEIGGALTKNNLNYRPRRKAARHTAGQKERNPSWSALDHEQ